MKLSEIIDLPENLSVGGYLYLRNTQITSLPENLSVGGSLDLRNTQITSLPENLSVGGSLYLCNTQITSLPENLSVGGYLDLRNTQIDGLITNVGDNDRTVYAWHHKEKGWVVSLGCFTGNEEETVSAIRRKYGNDSDYEAKVKQAFQNAYNRKLEQV